MMGDRKSLHSLRVAPRWPSRSVFVEERALRALDRTQAVLPAHIKLIVTRGYEPARSGLGRLRTLFRIAGIMTFVVLFPHRRSEIVPIFGANGHDIDGTHVDLSIELDGKRLRFLPLGVFTPIWLQERIYRRHAVHVDCVRRELVQNGFAIHSNGTEAFQIHCDYIGDGESAGGPFGGSGGPEASS